MAESIAGLILIFICLFTLRDIKKNKDSDGFDVEGVFGETFSSFSSCVLSFGTILLCFQTFVVSVVSVRVITKLVINFSAIGEIFK